MSKKLLLISIFCFIVIVAVELLLKFSSIVSTSSMTQAVDPTSPIIHFKPNHEFVYSRGWNAKLSVKHKTNNFGFNTETKFLDKTVRSKEAIALIGDSYVEALQVKGIDSIGGILTNRSNKLVYPLGISGSPLSQYLAFAQYAHEQLDIDRFIFVVTSNGFDESLMQYKAAPGYHYFDEENDMKLTLVDWHPNTLMRVLQTSSLMQYLINNLQVSALIYKFRGVQPISNDIDPARIASSQKAIHQFFVGLEEVGIKREDVFFVVDADREAIYKGNERDLTTLYGMLTNYFVTTARKDNFKIIDMQDVLMPHYAAEKTKFNFSFDYHWNELGHKLAAESILDSGFMD